MKNIISSFDIEFGGSFNCSKLPESHLIIEAANAASAALDVEPSDALAADRARLDGEEHNEAHTAAYDAAERAVDALCAQHVGYTPHDGFGVMLK